MEFYAKREQKRLEIEALEKEYAEVERVTDEILRKYEEATKS